MHPLSSGPLACACRRQVPATAPNVFAAVLRLLDCLLLQFVPKPDAEPNPEALAAATATLPKVVEPLFVMALTWAVGGLVNLGSRHKFDAFLRKLLKEKGSKASLPSSGTVFDVTFDVESLSWKPWLSTVPAYSVDSKVDFKADYSSIIVPTSASVCYTTLLRTLMRGDKHTLVVGPTGTAKSVTVQQFFAQGLDSTFEPIAMAFSAQTSANQTQDILDAKFEKRRQGQDKDSGLAYTMWGPMLGKRFLLFIDDFNMPKRETYGAQPPVELMRQLVDHDGWYDRKTLRFRKIVDVTLVGAMGPPGGGRQPMTNRMLRHMHMISFVDMSEETISGVFTTIVGAFLQSMSKDLQPLTTPIVAATIAMYTTTCEVLRPTPAKPHYTFNLRDVSKVIQGVLMADKRRVTTKEQLVKLWTHECARVFADRLINDDDRNWFLAETKKVVKDKFSMSYESAVPSGEQLLYCNFYTAGADPPIYEEVADMSKLSELLAEHQKDYNEQHIPMDLVLFGDALAHICRISRVLSQPSGNALLLG
eukprot:2602070-Pleurochrysis_carterae.AAC.2